MDYDGLRRRYWEQQAARVEQSRLRSPKKIIRLRHSSLIDLTKRSAYAFRLGERYGGRTTSPPAVFKRFLNAMENLESRSRMRNRLSHLGWA